MTILIPPDRIDEEPQTLERIRRGEQVDHYETVRRRKDGSELDISLTVSPIRDNTGKVIGASKIARDVTERKRVEAALRESEERFRIIVSDTGGCGDLLPLFRKRRAALRFLCGSGEQ